MPLVNSGRASSQSTAPVWTERTRRELTESVLHEVGTVVERQVQRHLRLDSLEVRRLSESLYSDLGSRLVFERERLGTF